MSQDQKKGAVSAIANLAFRNELVDPGNPAHVGVGGEAPWRIGASAHRQVHGDFIPFHTPAVREYEQAKSVAHIRCHNANNFATKITL